MVNCEVLAFLTDVEILFDLTTTKFQFWLAIIIQAT